MMRLPWSERSHHAPHRLPSSLRHPVLLPISCPSHRDEPCMGSGDVRPTPAGHMACRERRGDGGITRWEIDRSHCKHRQTARSAYGLDASALAGRLLPRDTRTTSTTIPGEGARTYPAGWEDCRLSEWSRGGRRSSRRREACERGGGPITGGAARVLGSTPVTGWNRERAAQGNVDTAGALPTRRASPVADVPERSPRAGPRPAGDEGTPHVKRR
jgi:hypothetical protein